MCVRKDLWSVSCILIVSHLALLFDVDLSSAKFLMGFLVLNGGSFLFYLYDLS